MDELLVAKRVGKNRSICLSTLAKNQIAEDPEYTGTDFGYFIYELDHTRRKGGIRILAKVLSVDAALRLVEVIHKALSAAELSSFDPCCNVNDGSAATKKRRLRRLAVA